VNPSLLPGLAGPIAVVCDFDGTVASADVQHVIFNHFASERWVPINEAWRRGEISPAQRARAQWDMVQATPEQILDTVRPVAMDPGFPAFAALCRRLRWPLTIASDGFDLYISALLTASGLQGIPVSANRLHWSGSGFVMEFARPNPACCRLGNCKRLAVIDARPSGGQVIFVGDGLSDACGAEAANLVFAKGLLADYCRQKGIPFQTFGGFADIIARLSQGS
jgi:2-hydroxy-3-keto-5-methylthiopentenyl-1-phosphate phosphatase